MTAIDAFELAVVVLTSIVVIVTLPFNGYVVRRLTGESRIPPDIAALSAAAKVSQRIALALVLFAVLAVNGIVLLVAHVRLLPMTVSLLLLALGILAVSTAQVPMLRQLRRWASEARAFRVHARNGEPEGVPHRRSDDPEGREVQP